MLPLLNLQLHVIAVLVTASLPLAQHITASMCPCFPKFQLPSHTSSYLQDVQLNGRQVYRAEPET